MTGKNTESFNLIVVGGGAAGFFAAISACELSDSPLKVLILEGQKSCLSKVKVSGGGRCNITHNQLDPRELVKEYPRGSKEMLGPFFHWGPKEMLGWFTEQGLDHAIELDGRIFPKKNSSQAVIDCFWSLVKSFDIRVQVEHKVEKIERSSGVFRVTISEGPLAESKNILLATGGSRLGHKLASSHGHTVTQTYPSIFTFKVKDEALNELSGLSLLEAGVSLKVGGKTFSAVGPVLVTHWGLSGPCILRVSAFAARELAAASYRGPFELDFFPRLNTTELIQALQNQGSLCPKKSISSVGVGKIPKRLWSYLVKKIGFSNLVWRELNSVRLDNFAHQLKNFELQMHGRAVYKEEFVTAGGVDNREVDFRSMQSKLVEGLYFAGEILDVDGVTGGFNFQNAWTTGRLAGAHIAQNI